MKFERKMQNGNFYRAFAKPTVSTGVDDWHSRSQQLCNLADLQRTNAFELRQVSRGTRNDTQIQSHFQRGENDNRLANRVQEIERWYTEIQLCSDRLHKEAYLLRAEKNVTETYLDELNGPLSIVGECLSMRDNRVCGELTLDAANAELKCELGIVENSMKLLKDQCQKAWEQLNRLNDVAGKLDIELLHKNEARSVDNQQKSINKLCLSVTFKTAAMRNPKNSCTYDGWLEHTEQMQTIANNEMESSCRMRESLFVAREKIKNSLKSQQEISEYTLRKRIFDTQRIRNEFEWNIIKNKTEMKTLLKEIDDIKNSLDINAKSRKLVETRLENRCQRPAIELCMDDTYTSLCVELKQLVHSQHQLNEKLQKTTVVYNELEANLYRLESDNSRKQHALATDIRALDLRQRLKRNAIEENTAENRQLSLTSLQKQMPENYYP